METFIRVLPVVKTLVVFVDFQKGVSTLGNANLIRRRCADISTILDKVDDCIFFLSQILPICIIGWLLCVTSQQI